MERLPFLLRNAIESACGQFRNIQYTLHGDDNKARISIMFSNSENKPPKRKSSATAKRDNKRMKEFIENRATDTIEQSDVLDTHATSEDRTIDNIRKTFIANKLQNMDIDSIDIPRRTSQIESTQTEPVIDFSPVVNIDTSTIEISEPSSVEVIDNQSTVDQNIKCKQSGGNVERLAKKDNSNSITKDRKVFTKIVFPNC